MRLSVSPLLFLRTFFVTLLVFFYSVSAFADEMSNGNGYWARCQENQHPYECLAFFEGLIHGTAQGIEHTVMLIYPDKTYEQFDTHRQSLTGFCLPEKATVGQMFDTFLKYLKDNPSKRDNTTGLLYRFAMHDAFPCAPKKNS